MSTNLSLHSNAMNFLSFMKNGVDPRTGQYTLSVELPALLGNRQCEPSLTLNLDFNPLNQADSGYGKGWNLNLSQYSTKNQVLSLSTGESFQLTDSSSGQRLGVNEQKLTSFNVYKEGKDSLDKVKRFRVMHRSGVVEILQVHGKSTALPVEIHSPKGHKLYLTYTHFQGDEYVVDTIKDSDQAPLLKVERSAGQVTFDYLPFTKGTATSRKGATTSRLRYTMVLEGSENWVSQITLPGDEPAAWQFRYRNVLGILCLDTVHTPTGAREYLSYEDGGHPFPGNIGPNLPRVTRHRIEPRFGQPPMEVTYTYGFMDAGGVFRNHSFIGSGTNIGWDDSGRDNLYKYVGPYEYRSQEQARVNGNVVRTVERRFNRFHLQTAEITTQGNTVAEVLNEYAAIDDKPFDQQPATCQLIIKEQRRWRLLDNARPSRSEYIETTYDNHGNIRTKKLANGVIERFEWYSAAGEEGCPADPEGFVRHLKQKTTTPAPAPGKTPARVQHERYRYLTLPRLNDPEHDETNPDHAWHKQQWHAVHSETVTEQTDTEQVLSQARYYYANSAGDLLLHGRRYLQVKVCNGLETVTQWHFTQVDGPDAGHPALQTEQVLIGYDGTRRSTLDQRSLQHGKPLLVRNENGVDICYEYDPLLRVTKETVAPGTAFEAVREYAYTFANSTGGQTSQTVTNARKVKTLTLVDGLARVVEERRDNVYEGYPQRFHTTHTLRYDALGQRASETRSDWLHAQGSRDLTQYFEYDEWGQQCCLIGPEGVDATAIGSDAVRVYEVTDPLGSREHPSGPIVTSWRQVGRGSSEIISNWEQVWQNLFEKPQRSLRLDASGGQRVTRTYAYDGLGRCVRELDERLYATDYSYDGWGRMISTQLADGTRVERDYAPHTEADLPTGITVIPDNATLLPCQIGERWFDGLDRLGLTRTGPRTEYFYYRGGESHLREHKTAAGATVTYDYNLALTTEPTSIVAKDEEDLFAFNPVSARLTTADNAKSGRSYDYNIANQIIEERWVNPQDATTKSRKYLSSVEDRLLQSIEANGITTEHSYDRYGRLATTVQGAVRATHAYDELARLLRITTLDTVTSTELVTELTYDHRDRECRRIWRQAGRPDRLQVQEWGGDDLLISRELTENNQVLLKESFVYDRRSRLTSHRCEGTQLPRDALGRAIQSQTFVMDAYDNVSTTVTQYADGSRQERARYFYAANDPCQLRRIEYTPARPTGNSVLRYDANGNLISDERGRTLTYDSRNKLLSVDATRYRYDGFGHLLGKQDANGEETLLLFDGDRLRLAVRGSLNSLYCHLGDWPLAQQSNDGKAPLLLQTSASHSVIAESLAGDYRYAAYTAYGAQPVNLAEPLRAGLGYNGEAVDADSGWYLLGTGYRAYNPALMRFHSPDVQSPFGEGGLNYYAYCEGNPVNFRDPTGASAIGWSGRLREVYEDDPNNGTVRARSTSLRTVGFWIAYGISVVVTAFAVAAAVVATAGAATPAIFAATAALKVTGAALATASTVAGGINLADPNNTKAGDIALWTGIAAAATYLPGTLNTIRRGMGQAFKALARHSPKWLSHRANRIGMGMPKFMRYGFNKVFGTRTDNFSLKAAEYAYELETATSPQRIIPPPPPSPLEKLTIHSNRLFDAQLASTSGSLVRH